MTALTIFEELQACGIDLAVEPNGKLTAPANTLTPEQRARVKAHRSELIHLILQAQQTIDELMTAAMRCCDAFHDSPAAREQMRHDILNTPLELQQDLLDYFKTHYGGIQCPPKNNKT